MIRQGTVMVYLASNADCPFVVHGPAQGLI